MGATLESHPPESGRERRRFERFPVEITARVLGLDEIEVEVTLLNLSRGGALINGPAKIKSALFQPKRYTHRPVPVLLVIDAQGANPRRALLGRCKYLQKLPDGRYNAGFGFAQLQPLKWVAALSAARDAAQSQI